MNQAPTYEEKIDNYFTEFELTEDVPGALLFVKLSVEAEESADEVINTAVAFAALERKVSQSEGKTLAHVAPQAQIMRNHFEHALTRYVACSTMVSEARKEDEEFAAVVDHVLSVYARKLTEANQAASEALTEQLASLSETDPHTGFYL